MAHRHPSKPLAVASALAVVLLGCSAIRQAEAGHRLLDANNTAAPPPAAGGTHGKVSNSIEGAKSSKGIEGAKHKGKDSNGGNGPSPPWVCSAGQVGCGYRYSSPPPSSRWPYPDFPYQGCYYQSTGAYKIKFHAAYPDHEETRYCFWVEAKHPDPHSHEQCRNFDLWSISFRVHIDCYDEVSYLTYNGQQLDPVWAPNLPPTKAMLQVTRGDGQVLDSQGSVASHRAEVCFTLPNHCPLDKFCKGSQCKAAFYPSPYSGLNCCPGSSCKSHWWEGH